MKTGSRTSAHPQPASPEHQSEACNGRWEAEIETLRRYGLYRVMPDVDGMPGRTVTMLGREVLNFSSNNYLGLAGHPRVIQASVDCTQRYGAGSTASRLIAGNNVPHRELEDLVAGWKQTEAALVFGSGYQANVGIITSLTAEHDLIISDRLNHASLIDGCRLSKAETRVLRHCDADHLEYLLSEAGPRRTLVITESIFSMDGDEAPLADMYEVCKRLGAMLMVDEAHATGIRGPAGQGLAAELGITPDIQMGTLGKAVGSAGAYAAADRAVIDILINRARSFVYTTAPPPGSIGAAMEAIQIIGSEEGEELRRKLRRNVHKFGTLLRTGLGTDTNPSHIVPYTIGDSHAAMEVSARCLDHGVFAHGIRYPTVPEGSARIRFTLMSTHSEDDLARAVTALRTSIHEIDGKHGVPDACT